MYRLPPLRVTVSTFCDPGHAYSPAKLSKLALSTLATGGSGITFTVAESKTTHLPCRFSKVSSWRKASLRLTSPKFSLYSKMYPPARRYPQTGSESLKPVFRSCGRELRVLPADTRPESVLVSKCGCLRCHDN